MSFQFKNYSLTLISRFWGIMKILEMLELERFLIINVLYQNQFEVQNAIAWIWRLQNRGNKSVNEVAGLDISTIYNTSSKNGLLFNW